MTPDLFGETVIFVDENYNEHPAIITRINNLEEGIVNLWVIVDSVVVIETVAKFNVPQGDGEPYSWHSR